MTFQNNISSKQRKLFANFRKSFEAVLTGALGLRLKVGDSEAEMFLLTDRIRV